MTMEDQEAEVIFPIFTLSSWSLICLLIGNSLLSSHEEKMRPGLSWFPTDHDATAADDDTDEKNRDSDASSLFGCWLNLCYSSLFFLNLLSSFPPDHKT